MKKNRLRRQCYDQYSLAYDRAITPRGKIISSNFRSAQFIEFVCSLTNSREKCQV